MASTPSHPPEAGPAWRIAGFRYYPLRFYYNRHFGRPVWKVSIDASFGCPNRDGTLGTLGCVFCDPAAFSPSRRFAAEPLARQIDRGLERIRRRRPDINRAIAYFQPGTNTYAPVARLRAVYEEALAHPAVVGLAVGTRPDCLGDDVLDLLADVSRRTWLGVEIGLQSIHDRSLAWMRRGHGYNAFVDAVRRGHARGLRLGAHVILGLPGETRDDMLATADALVELGIASVKLHQLYAVRDTPLAQAVAAGEVRLLDLDEFVACAVEFLEHLGPDCVIDRLLGDAPAEYLIGPDWCRDKPRALAAIENELARRDTWQGRSRATGSAGA
ncbi:MAG: TIGR01212 family radical SAM protein [Pirellulales bacterium]|nr:TIGR01212 family radical SAM protein [Pirellulales bacterium]